VGSPHVRLADCRLLRGGAVATDVLRPRVGRRVAYLQRALLIVGAARVDALVIDARNECVRCWTAATVEIGHTWQTAGSVGHARRLDIFCRRNAFPIALATGVNALPSLTTIEIRAVGIERAGPLANAIVAGLSGRTMRVVRACDALPRAAVVTGTTGETVVVDGALECAFVARATPVATIAVAIPLIVLAIGIGGPTVTTKRKQVRTRRQSRWERLATIDRLRTLSVDTGLRFRRDLEHADHADTCGAAGPVRTARKPVGAVVRALTRFVLLRQTGGRRAVVVVVVTLAAADEDAGGNQAQESKCCPISQYSGSFHGRADYGAAGPDHKDRAKEFRCRLLATRADGARLACKHRLSRRFF